MGIRRVFWLLLAATLLFAAGSVLKEVLAAYRADTLKEQPALLERLEAEAEEDRNAAFLLATIHKNGKAGATDEEKAIHWYRKAAGRGDPDAMLMLGWLYYKGTPTIRPNAQKATFWFRQAAALGVDEAVEILEMMETR